MSSQILQSRVRGMGLPKLFSSYLVDKHASTLPPDLFQILCPLHTQL